MIEIIKLRPHPRLIFDMWRFFRTTMPAFVAILTVSLFLGMDAAVSESLAVTKKSSSGICHCPGGQFYDRTKKFTPYRSIKECLDSGGRHPKRGQGDCTGTAARDPDRPKAEGRPVVPRSPTKARTDKLNRIAVTSSAYVVDGDTIRLDVRLQCVDTPETRPKMQKCRGQALCLRRGRH